MRRTRAFTAGDRELLASQGRALLAVLLGVTAVVVALALFWFGRRRASDAYLWLGVGAMADCILGWFLIQHMRDGRAGGFEIEELSVEEWIRLGDDGCYCRMAGGAVIYFRRTKLDDGPTTYAMLKYGTQSKSFHAVEWSGHRLEPVASLPDRGDERPEQGIALKVTWDSLLARAPKPR